MTALAVDPYEALDEALAVRRALWQRINAATARGDTAAIESLTAQRETAAAEVRRRIAGVQASGGDASDTDHEETAAQLQLDDGQGNHQRTDAGAQRSRAGEL